ncbi:hypothetical protein CYMTET_47931 [Cymbomonas tetramitiformis]|uniref:Uncharacterized protein n=1 Tax=Cymbomonas tetramitiformis TaxID=36881 RepID=A0AAE0EW51_9CHLO|nr:hypothetical protein CYMTET_47931 [Cymbomonas tetramitiformis]
MADDARSVSTSILVQAPQSLGTWHHQSSSNSWAERISREDKKISRPGPRTAVAELRPKAKGSRKNDVKSAPSTLDKLSIGGMRPCSSRGDRQPDLKPPTASGALGPSRLFPHNTSKALPSADVFLRPPSVCHSFVSEYRGSYNHGKAANLTSLLTSTDPEDAAKLHTTVTNLPPGTANKLAPSRPPSSRPFSSAKPPPTAAVCPPTPHITRPTKLPSLRDPVSGRVNDLPPTVREEVAMEAHEWLAPLQKTRPLTGQQRPPTGLPSRLGTSSARGLQSHGRLSTAKIPETPSVLGTEDNRSVMSEVDIVERQRLTGAQLGPMVLNLENIEESTLEVLEMELARSDDEFDDQTELDTEYGTEQSSMEPDSNLGAE